MLEFFKNSLKNFDGDYEEIVTILINFLKFNHVLSSQVITADALNNLYDMDPINYIMNHSDEDVELMIKTIENKDLTGRELIIFVANLIWEIVTYMGEDSCPSCQQTNLRLYTDKYKEDVYELCTECFACRKGDRWLPYDSREELYPATKDLVVKHIDMFNS